MTEWWLLSPRTVSELSVMRTYYLFRWSARIFLVSTKRGGDARVTVKLLNIFYEDREYSVII